MNKKPAPTFECQFCGKTTDYRPSMGKNGRQCGWQRDQKFCSKECGYKGRRWRPINPDGHKHSSGYIRIHYRGGHKRLKQRVVMEESLGRPLVRGETVHHKDGDRTNNALDNLELWSKAHPAGQRVIDKVDFAIEILRLYPEFARQRGVELRELEPPINGATNETHGMLSLPS